MPTVGDHGGKSYGQARQTEVRVTNVVSMRCRDCQKLRYVPPRELDRAALPRCIGCTRWARAAAPTCTRGGRQRPHSSLRVAATSR